MAVAKIKTSTATTINIGIDSRARKEVVKCLTHLLAETYVIQLKTQYYHWNVTGPHFQGLHILFESQYNAISASVDEIAERIRALGYPTPGTFAEFISLSSVKEDKTLPSNWQAMVKNLVSALELATRNVHEWLPQVQKAGDEATADLLIKMLQEHEKSAWMLRSHLE